MPHPPTNPSPPSATPTGQELQSQTLGEFLVQLAARLPAPGAGATAAVEAALSASLIAMVGRFTTDDEHADAIREIVEAADAQREACMAAAAADESAFAAVAEAMGMPSTSEREKDARRAALAGAQRDAAQPPRAVIHAATELVSLAERLLPIANANLVSDVAAATAAARAAASTARLAVETNLRGITDEHDRADLTSALARVDDVAQRADVVEEAVRGRISGRDAG
ncbi:cyclodeaminase/cyclohydrolase family protein [Pseudonocardia humida]|uniref:Cyclodeaminase/cyclohydrolase family protein n=1 Tax=Pseudonocardia humida TaxID=2800819 RepID=A0ABT1A056_9PSEU|nr:cyclodeaminase/cyclohydrolase family protein [Pseudonocardia humida]MCO1656386.1 cyclodeaminase/cyclohydrolase family protein [Pseudonocardia humida]